MPKAKLKVGRRVNGGIDETIAEILRVTLTSVGQTSRLAEKLYTGNIYADSHAIYNLIVDNIAYKLDPMGTEEIRTPARTWHDRFTGVDCEDYAIYAATLLINMGYVPVFEIVAFNNSDQFAHIFVTAYTKKGLGPYIIDPTPVPGKGPVPFNQRPPAITRTLSVNGLSGFKTLSGVGFVKHNIFSNGN